MRRKMCWLLVFLLPLHRPFSSDSGILIYLFVEQKGIQLPTLQGNFVNTDEVYPLLTLHYFGQIGAIAFFIGVIASTFASIDACITALTTAFSYDFLDFENQPHEAKEESRTGYYSA